MQTCIVAFERKKTPLVHWNKNDTLILKEANKHGLWNELENNISRLVDFDFRSNNSLFFARYYSRKIKFANLNIEFVILIWQNEKWITTIHDCIGWGREAASNDDTVRFLRLVRLPSNNAVVPEGVTAGSSILRIDSVCRRAFAGACESRRRRENGTDATGVYESRSPSNRSAELRSWSRRSTDSHVGM